MKFLSNWFQSSAPFSYNGKWLNTSRTYKKVAEYRVIQRCKGRRKYLLMRSKAITWIGQWQLHAFILHCIGKWSQRLWKHAVTVTKTKRENACMSCIAGQSITTTLSHFQWRELRGLCLVMVGPYCPGCVLINWIIGWKGKSTKHAIAQKVTHSDVLELCVIFFSKISILLKLCILKSKS